MESPLTCLTNQSSVYSSHHQTDSIDSDQSSEPLTIKTEDIDSQVIQRVAESQLSEFKSESAAFNVISDSLKNIKEEQSALVKAESGIDSPISASSLKDELSSQSSNQEHTSFEPPAPLFVVKKNSKSKVSQPKSGPVKRAGTGTRNTTAEKKYKCQFCEKAFACGYSLTRHVRIHTGEQCYKCDVCEKVFTTRSSKIRHDRTHLTEGTYKCEFCNKLFKKPNLLAEHQKEHTGQKPYPCDLCGKAFSKRFQLTSHLKTHQNPSRSTAPKTGTKGGSELCELCGQGFPSKPALIEHLKEHVAEKALQSDLVDSSNNIEDIIGTESVIPSSASPVVSPFPGLVSVSLPSIDSPSLQSINQPNPVLLTSPDGSSVLTDTVPVVETDIALESKLEANIVYVVGEDGTLQPQINYSLVSPSGAGTVETPISEFITHPLATGEGTPVAEFLKGPLNLSSSSNSETPVLNLNTAPLITDPLAESTPVEVKLEPKLEPKQEPGGDLSSTDIVDSTNSVLFTQASTSSGSETPLVITQASSDPITQQLPSEEPSDNSLVIAQADTTSLDSLKSDDEASGSPKPSFIGGQDILALACQEFLEIAPIPEEEDIADPSTPPVTDSEISGGAATAAGKDPNMHYPEKKFHCDYCDKSFTQRNNLASHMRTHTGEKPFKCFHCDEAFSQRWSLTRHLRIHTGEKPFKCQWCDACFRLKGEKTEHEKAQHMNERNERIANSKLNGIGEHVSMEIGDGTPTRRISENGMIINSSALSESASQSLLQTDDSDSRSDYDSIQSGHYGDSAANGGGDSSKSALLLENNQENFSSHMTALLGTNLPHQLVNEIKFHYGNEEYMDTSGVGSPAAGAVVVPTSGTVLTPLEPAEIIAAPSIDEKVLNHHCDFCEASFATKSELVQHFSAHTD